MNYDKYPEIKINGFDDQVFADVQGIKNELEKYLRTHKCNKTYIVHIKETLRKKHIYEDYMFKIIEAKEYYKINK